MTDVHLIEGRFGLIMIKESSTASITLYRQDFDISQQFVLNASADMPALQVLISLEGDAQITIDGLGEVHLRQGQFYMFYTPVVHTATIFTSKQKLSIVALFLPPGQLDELAGLFPLEHFLHGIKHNQPTALRTMPGWICAEVSGALHFLFQHTDDEHLRQQLFSLKLKSMLLVLLQQVFQTGREPVRPIIYDQLMEAKYLIETHSGPAIKPEAVASTVHMDTDDLKQYFSSVLGISVARFIARARLQQAQFLLQETDLNISEIAKRCGYVSAQKFIQAYKQHFGFTPSFLRKKKTHLN
ncbi:MAG: helix-turn-helix transcriptional regulator [Bacteroidetes bacterium]|nr:helix-turn-helix transcriptional regulator [Bacteroidota bacterium]